MYAHVCVFTDVEHLVLCRYGCSLYPLLVSWLRPHSATHVIVGCLSFNNHKGFMKPEPNKGVGGLGVIDEIGKPKLL